MHEIKVKNFEREYGHSFPWHIHVDDNKCTTIRSRVAGLLGLPSIPDPLQLSIELARQSVLLAGEDADSDDFQLDRVFSRAGIGPQRILYISWWRLTDIDMMNYNDVSRYFDDIWYPSADDISLLDETVSWVVTIYHHGAVTYFLPGRK